MAAHLPHKANVPGDFYVEDGCCITCAVPVTEAPKHFAWQKDAQGYDHCYVCKQPETPGELRTMLRVIPLSEVYCIRYRGSDPAVLANLVENGCAEVCDHFDSRSMERNVPWWRRLLRLLLRR